MRRAPRDVPGRFRAMWFVRAGVSGLVLFDPRSVSIVRPRVVRLIPFGVVGREIWAEALSASAMYGVDGGSLVVLRFFYVYGSCLLLLVTYKSAARARVWSFFIYNFVH